MIEKEEIVTRNVVVSVEIKLKVTNGLFWQHAVFAFHEHFEQSSC